MIKRLLLLTIVCMSLTCAFAQSSAQDKLNSIMAETQRKMDSLKKDPKLKQYLDKSNTNTTAGATPSMPSFPIMPAKKPDTAILSKIKIPDKNVKGLASIPSKPMSKKDLVAFIGDMKSKVMTSMNTTSGRQPLAVASYDASSLANASLLAWYNCDGDAAIELALDAALKDPDNMNALNNLSGILNMCGFAYKSVPILEYVNEQKPGNSTVENNLGQAYIQMGDQQKGSAYLKQAVANAPYHPNANYALACISFAGGDKNGAIGYCENALRGGFISDAWTMLKATKPDAKLMDYIRHHYKQPDFFNIDKYPLPQQCRLAADARSLQAEYKQYKNMLESVKKTYQAKMRTESDYIKNNMAAELMKKVNQQQAPLRPFGAFAEVVLGDIHESYGDTRARLAKYDSNYFDQVNSLRKQFLDARKPIDEKYKKRGDEAGEGNPDTELEKDYCKEINTLADTYLPKFADLTEARQQKWKTLTSDYFNDCAFWIYVGSVDDHHYQELFDELVLEYLNMQYDLCNTEFISCTQQYNNTKEKSTDLEFKEGECPLTANIDVKVIEKDEEGKEKEKTKASFDIDCEAFTAKLKMSNGISFKIKQNASGSTTLAFCGSGDIKEILSGSMQAYIVFGGNEPFDVGFKWDYGMKLPGMEENTAGWSVSMNSMAEFHGKGKIVDITSGWAEKNIFGLDPINNTQINPHVKVYNH